MPDLDGLALSSNPRVPATGRVIKGLYDSHGSAGPHDLAALHMTCERHLEPKPFLVMDFRSRQFFFDGNRDGCMDATETLPLPEIDPADFAPAIDGAEEFCYEDPVSSLHQGILAASFSSLGFVPHAQNSVP
jgi:hypothetical protein